MHEWIASHIALLDDPLYKYGVLTFLATSFSILIKRSSRPSGAMRAEDWACGFDLAQVAIFALLADGAAATIHDLNTGKSQFNAQTVVHLIGTMLLLFLMMGATFFVAQFARNHGWNVPPRMVSALLPDYFVLNWVGISIPLVFGMILIACTVVWMEGK